MKEITGFPGYFADKKGNIYSQWQSCGPHRIKSNQFKLLKGCIKNNGYKEYGLINNNHKKIYILGHRLILLVFIGSCPQGLQTRHINGKKTDNALSNLCYGTPKQNGEDKIRHGTTMKGEKNNHHILTFEQVKYIRKELNKGQTIINLAQKFKVHITAIYNINNNKTWYDITYKPKYIGIATGKRLPQTKLTNIDVKEIRKLLKQNLTQQFIANKFKVHQNTISKINTNKIWKNI